MMARAALPVAGLAIWAARFVAVYAVTAVACAKGWDTAIVTAAILSTAALGLALNAMIVAAGLRLARASEAGAAPALGAVGAGIAALSSLAIVLETLPALIVPVCAVP